MDCMRGLKNAYSRPLFSAGDFDRKVRQTDLAFGVRSRFTNRSVRARLQVSVCSSCHLCQPASINTHTVTQTAFWPALIRIVQPTALKRNTCTRVFTSTCWTNNRISKSKIVLLCRPNMIDRGTRQYAGN